MEEEAAAQMIVSLIIGVSVGRSSCRHPGRTSKSWRKRRTRIRLREEREEMNKRGMPSSSPLYASNGFSIPARRVSLTIQRGTVAERRFRK